jgi:hypothetical protein
MVKEISIERTLVHRPWRAVEPFIELFREPPSDVSNHYLVDVKSCDVHWDRLFRSSPLVLSISSTRIPSVFLAFVFLTALGVQI